MWEAVGKAAVAVVAARLLWSLLKGIYGTYLASALGLTCSLRKSGEWAVVTGATDGIGKAYAFELARRGFKVILVSRTLLKLQNVAAEINSKYNVETRVIDVDFTRTDIYERLEKELSDLDIGVLVNNVGISYDHPEFFLELEECQSSCVNMINCNVRSLTEMTRIVLPGMVKRGRGIVLNISSTSGVIPAPLLTVYGATKAYVRSFSESMCIELASSGVTMQCLLPGYVVSNMSRFKRPNLMIPTPEGYVTASLRTLGVEAQTAGYFMHKIQQYVIEVCCSYLPGCLLASVVLSRHKHIRAIYHRKKQREAKAQ